MTNSVSITGYVDRPNPHPGESLIAYISCDHPEPYSARLVRLIQTDPNATERGIDIRHVPSALDGQTTEAVKQRTQIGSYILVPWDPPLGGARGLTIHLFFQPTCLERKEAQCLLACWDNSRQRGWALEIEKGRLRFRVGDGAGRVSTVLSEANLFEGIWYEAVAVYADESHQLRLIQRPIVLAANGRFGPIVPICSESDVTVTAQYPPAAADSPLTIAAAVDEVVGGRAWCTELFDGKIDSPSLFSGSLTNEQVASLLSGERDIGALLGRWDFAAHIADGGAASNVVVDVSGNGRDGVTVNQPTRAVTGWNWSGREDNFRLAPNEYGAIWFHSDALDDCRWTPGPLLTLPDDLASGIYAIHIKQNEHEDYIPFFVSPSIAQSTKRIALLMPTLSYIVYANYRVVARWSARHSYDPYEAVNGSTPLGARDFEMFRRPGQYGVSGYDYHVDGTGCIYTTWRRPILDVRPNLSWSFNFQADMHLVDWLNASGFEVDIITDHDLHADGAQRLRPYAVVLTGTHPEYYTREMIDAWEFYLAEGGRGMYLGGNGMYWVTALHPEAPWVVEIRRGDTGDMSWRSTPGEYHHAFGGERGGLWRHRGRAPQKIWGVGYSAHDLLVSGSYLQLPDAEDPRMRWMFNGIAFDEAIGNFGLVNGGAAGIELDVYDRSLGTPPHTMLVASSTGHGEAAHVTPEEILNPHPGLTGAEHPKIRADMVFFTTKKGGAVFSASSIAWCGALPINGYRNNVATLTGNVLRRFADPTPIEPVV